ncbi:MAG TPA: hypothetical protein VIX89_14065 [Bryobacteraceae bacterium]
MTRILCCFLLTAIALFADVTGKWTGSFDATGPDGQTKPGTALFLLKQSGDVIAGTVGPNEDEQFTIKVGKIDGDKIALEVDPKDGTVIKFELTLAGGHIKGDAKGERGGEKMTAKVDVTQAK